MKLCKDCKHCGYNQPGNVYFTLSVVPCFRIPPVKKTCLINGDEIVISQLYCWLEREPSDIYTVTDICGVEGKYFESNIINDTQLVMSIIQEPCCYCGAHLPENQICYCTARA